MNDMRKIGNSNKTR